MSAWDGIEVRIKDVHTGHWGPWVPCQHMGTLAEHIPPLLNESNTALLRVAWKASYGDIFEYRRIPC